MEFQKSLFVVHRLKKKNEIKNEAFSTVSEYKCKPEPCFRSFSRVHHMTRGITTYNTVSWGLQLKRNPPIRSDYIGWQQLDLGIPFSSVIELHVTRWQWNIQKPLSGFTCKSVRKWNDWYNAVCLDLLMVHYVAWDQFQSDRRSTSWRFCHNTTQPAGAKGSHFTSQHIP